MAAPSSRRIQTAFEESRYDPNIKSIDERIETALFRCLVEELGVPEKEARARAQREIGGAIGRDVCGNLALMGVAIAGRRVLDLGAGMGGISTEFVRRGAIVVGLEPGSGWCRIAAERLWAIGVGGMISAVGEAIPLASNSIDIIVSHQVLEHVQNPQRVLEEAFRVLKPGGYFYFAYANYFSFREQHYRVFWLPLMPKVLGAAYLRLRGRNPQFLMESVTYTTFYGVRRVMAKLGFECLRRVKSARLLRSADMASLKWRVLKRLAAVNESAALDLICSVDYGKRLMRDAIYECVRKPAKASSVDSQSKSRSAGQ